MTIAIYRSQTGTMIRVKRDGNRHFEQGIIVRDGAHQITGEPITIVRIGHGERAVFVMLSECDENTYEFPSRPTGA